ncbi:glycosyltransferase [Rhizohabitans arisaemae]|uniref:glycosyltransferase n=1 Tax=Rhizohabitans arisaemae TaxID=2720610 RepID=UPI0024B0468A|nr:glycosyltransferase [Rhizohabitans arisaemae]
MKISLLLPTAYGLGGGVRSAFNLAARLADAHEVEIVSVERHREVPFLPLDPRVRLRSLVDTRPESGTAGPMSVAFARLPRLMRTDLALWRYLRTPRTDVLITGRPSLSILAARHAPRRVIRIAREHTPPVPERAGVIKRLYAGLDAVVAVSEVDRGEYASLLAGTGVRIRAIGNSLAPGNRPRSRMDNRIVAAAGRFVPSKSYDRLIHSFAIVVDKRPDWRLRLYGSGPEEKRLRSLVYDRELHNNVYFMGTTADIEGEFAKASVVAVTSRRESGAMSIIEALGCGVPVVSFAGLRGVEEIVESEWNGILVPEGEDDGQAFANALLGLIDDDEQRKKMGVYALETSVRYGSQVIGAFWEELIGELGAGRRS